MKVQDPAWTGERRAHDVGRRRPIRWIAAAVAVGVVAAVVLVVVSRSPANVGTAREIESTVEVKRGTGTFESVKQHPDVKAGDVVRTSDSGIGQIDYGDGSATRLDSNTVFTVDALITSGKRVMRASLSEGRVWNRVKKLTETGDRFQVRTPNAVATVRGTTFVCEALPLGSDLFDTTCMQVEGRTDVEFDNGASAQLGPGECTTNGGPCRYTPSQLRKMLAEFAALDGIQLPWKNEKQSEPTEAAETATSLNAPSSAVEVDDALEPRAGRGTLPNAADDDDDQQQDDESNAPTEPVSRPSDTNDDDDDDDGDDGGSSDAGGDEDPGDDGGEEEEGDGNNGCGDAEGGGRGGGCPHNGG